MKPFCKKGKKYSDGSEVGARKTEGGLDGQQRGGKNAYRYCKLCVCMCVLVGSGSCSCHEGRVSDACDQLTMKSALNNPAFTHKHIHYFLAISHFQAFLCFFAYATNSFFTPTIKLDVRRSITYIFVLYSLLPLCSNIWEMLDYSKKIISLTTKHVCLSAVT